MFVKDAILSVLVLACIILAYEWRSAKVTGYREREYWRDRYRESSDALSKCFGARQLAKVLLAKAGGKVVITDKERSKDFPKGELVRHEDINGNIIYRLDEGGRWTV